MAFYFRRALSVGTKYMGPELNFAVFHPKQSHPKTVGNQSRAVQTSANVFLRLGQFQRTGQIHSSLLFDYRSLVTSSGILGFKAPLFSSRFNVIYNSLRDAQNVEEWKDAPNQWDKIRFVTFGLLHFKDWSKVPKDELLSRLQEVGILLQDSKNQQLYKFTLGPTEQFSIFFLEGKQGVTVQFNFIPPINSSSKTATCIQPSKLPELTVKPTHALNPISSSIDNPLREIKLFKLLQILEADYKLSSKLFEPNPYYREELTRELVRNEAPIKEFQGELDDLEPNAVVLLPDLHGSSTTVELLRTFLRSSHCDWIGIEMLPHTMQKVIDQFLYGSAQESAEAEKALEAHFDLGWNRTFEWNNDAMKSPYMSFLREAKQQGKRILGLDVDREYYQNRPQTGLALQTRNVVWANQVPKEGRGVLFGGMGHFVGLSKKVSVQNCLHRRFPERPLYLVPTSLFFGDHS